ncbi:hypothetical protein [Butyricimonas sp. Marseille-P3923]|uniref:hypothetical protein n=1 Tax=Butyricimonas sp. Marseille-P3923 TaxID=1987504 RepID=UPI0011457CDB|nr:hypothetical protein [Butyricimonas sp. Marseille-P3923]
MTKVFEKFIFIFLLVVCVSVFVYIFVAILGVSFSYNIISPLNELKDGYYYQYPFLLVYDEPGKVYLFNRFSAVYDEPGVVGTFAVVFLVLSDYDFKKYSNIIIFIAGLLSFSMFFYGISLIILLYKVPFRYKLLITSIVLIVLFVLYKNEVFYNLIFRRFELGDDGNFVGINRTTQNFDLWYDRFMHTDEYFWGLGRGSNQRFNAGGASYKDIIVNYGLFFFIVYMLSFSLYSLRCIGFNKNWIIYIMLLYGVIYQRPFIEQIIYVMLIYIPIGIIKENNLCRIVSRKK